jgi:hypothetical protein
VDGEDVAAVVGGDRHVEQLARGDDVRRVQPQPRQAALRYAFCVFFVVSVKAKA